VPPSHVQGPTLQGMFLHLLKEVDPAVAAHLHDDRRYRPYTLSPLGIGKSTPSYPPQGGNTQSQEGKKPTPHPSQGEDTPPYPPQGGTPFRGFQLPRDRVLRRGTPCCVRVTLLEDDLFPTFSRYFLNRVEPSFRLGDTDFTVTNVLATQESGNPWSRYVSYGDLIDSQENPPLAPPRRGMQAGRPRSQERRITLRFVTPTSFSKGDVDLPLPLPRLVFQSYLKRFQEFHAFEFLPDFVELVDLHTGISRMERMRTDTIKTKKVTLTGFTGEVTFELSKKAPPELVFQMNLLADFAFFCGTGKKTTMGMGQTVRMQNAK